MVRSTTWMSSVTAGLLLAWQGSAAHAAEAPRASEPAARTVDYVADTPAESEFNRDSLASGAETVKERFPDGKVKTHREVTQDAQGNYLNHGLWKTWDQAGNLLAQGQYKYGARTGPWVRWYRGAAEADMLSKMPYQQFVGPFISQATFADGQLNGNWTIFDAKMHKISEWKFTDGKRDGLSTWYYPSGRKMREIEYRNGDIDGRYAEWNSEGRATVQDTYQAGRKLAKKTVNHGSTGKKKSEGIYLFAKEVEKTPDDWWNCKSLTTTKQGPDEKHGPWASWYASGQKQLEATYEHDMQVGLSTWWHANGQKALEGHFENGKQDGEWTWWYPNGQKSIHGEYANGNPTGRWTWWKEDGKVAQSADLSHSEGIVVDTPRTLEPPAPPVAKKPAARQPVKR